MRTVKLSDDVLAILRRSTIEAGVLRLPDERLERPLYTAVDKALQALGGKWNRKAAGHTFADPAALNEALASAIDSGTIAPPSKNGYFPTPPALVDRLLELADVQPHHQVLEPSAGQGAIADRLREIVGARNLYLVEILSENLLALHAKGYDYPKLVPGDFMRTSFAPSGFDRIVMNPPFERQQDIDHVSHAIGMLNPGGRLVSVMAAGVTFRTDRKAQEFRSLLDAFGGYVETNPPGAFRESGTDVSTVTVVVNFEGRR